MARNRSPGRKGLRLTHPVTPQPVFTDAPIAALTTAPGPGPWRMDVASPARERLYTCGERLFRPGADCPNRTALVRGCRPGAVRAVQETTHTLQDTLMSQATLLAQAAGRLKDAAPNTFFSGHVFGAARTTTRYDGPFYPPLAADLPNPGQWTQSVAECAIAIATATALHTLADFQPPAHGHPRAAARLAPFNATRTAAGGTAPTGMTSCA